MAELRFSIRLSSPAFANLVARGTRTVRSIGKVDGKDTVQSKEVLYYPVDPLGVRVPSLRGILAFWYRSLLGNSSNDEVFRAQAEVFDRRGRGRV